MRSFGAFSRHRSSRIGAMVGVVAVGTLAAGPALPASAAADDVVLVGHGYGHGRGMGQYGAYGYVVDHGWKYTTVLNHFYRGTSMGAVGDPVVRVRLTSIEPRTDTWVTSAVDFRVGGYRVAAKSAARLVWSTARGAWRLQTKYAGCSSSPTAWETGAKTDTAELRTSGSTARDTLVVCRNNIGYAGTFRWVRDGGSTVLVNSVRMQAYLRGVVPRESPASWGNARGGWGMEALKAQAVVARSYASAQHRYAYAKTCDTTSCQVYGGFTLGGSPTTDPRTDTAVAATSGQVRVNAAGAVQATEFSSSTGGYSAGGAFPAVRDDGDRVSPHHAWTVRIRGATIARVYGVGTFRQLKVVSANGLGGSGRVTAVDVIGTTRTVRVSGDDVRTGLGLKSAWFYPAIQPRQQATNVRYVRLAHAPEVYRLFSTPGSTRAGRAWVTASDYAASGRPRVSVVKPAYVRLSWSGRVYATYRWPGEPYPQVDVLSTAQWQKAGSPRPTVVGNLYGSMWYRYSGRPEVHVETPDHTEGRHHVTPAQWRASGHPPLVVR